MEKTTPDAPNPERRGKRNRRIGCAVALLLALGSCHVAKRFVWGPWETLKHEDGPVSWLPASARDITRYEYRHTFGRRVYYEATLPEEDARAFARANGWDLSEATEAAVRGREELGLPPLKKPETVEWIEGEEVPRPFLDVVDNALVYQSPRISSGGVRIVYDRDRHRLYYYYTNR